MINIFGRKVEFLERTIYQNISGKKPQQFQLDSSGVPYIVYEGKIGKQYNVVTVAEHAINLAGENNSMKSENFMNCIIWLTKNNVQLNDSSILFLDYYDWPGYNMTSPWRSAMNQSRAMEAFVKAFEMTNDSIFLLYAKRSMNALFTEVKDGGVTYKDTSGYWYEEYSDDTAPQSRVLNGMIVVLQGLSAYHHITSDHEALFLFNKGISSVKRTLHMYDNNGHTNYDILGKPATIWYHRFHVKLVDFLYKETHDLYFLNYYQKWNEYKEPSYLEILYKKPTRIGVFTVFIIITAMIAIVFCLRRFFKNLKVYSGFVNNKFKI